jgi:hypothetical protein
VLDVSQITEGNQLTDSEAEDGTGRAQAGAVTTNPIVPNPLLDKALANVRVTKDGHGKGVCLDLKGIYVYANGAIVHFADGTQLPYDDGYQMLMEMGYLLHNAQLRADRVAKQTKAAMKLVRDAELAHADTPIHPDRA